MSNIFVVLGMHRSGTSLTSSMLQVAGISMNCGDCSNGDETQPHGYYEDIAFKTINRAILHGAKGNWHTPPSVKAIKRSAVTLHDDMVKLIKKRSNSEHPWGWKDPRTSLTANVWLQVILGLGHSPHFIFTKRDETGVIESLYRRNGKDLATWAGLYHLYDNRLNSFEHTLIRRGLPYIALQFRELVSGDAVGAVTKLAQFIHREGRAGAMAKQIRQRG